MLDPFRHLNPPPLQALSARIGNRLHLPTLPLHAHEVLFAISLYVFVARFVSPWLSARLLPNVYGKLDGRTRINWHVHVVSFLQSCIVNALSFYVIFYDEERTTWRDGQNWELRIWGYTGLTGLLQSFALGYFLWDLYMCVRHVGIFGWGMVVHAIASSTMFVFGFRPFIHFYCPVFLLHELSTPFLNIHWFCDKVGLTGSIYQAVNGGILTLTFFLCRLVWGTYGAYCVSRDVWRATAIGYTTSRYAQDKIGQLPAAAALGDPTHQTTSFMTVGHLPTWLAASYLTANVALALLNFFWFSKMIETIRKRFEPPLGTKRSGKNASHDKTN